MNKSPHSARENWGAEEGAHVFLPATDNLPNSCTEQENKVALIHEQGLSGQDQFQ